MCYLKKISYTVVGFEAHLNELQLILVHGSNGTRDFELDVSVGDFGRLFEFPHFIPVQLFIWRSYRVIFLFMKYRLFIESYFCPCNYSTSIRRSVPNPFLLVTYVLQSDFKIHEFHET